VVAHMQSGKRHLRLACEGVDRHRGAADLLRVSIGSLRADERRGAATAGVGIRVEVLR